MKDYPKQLSWLFDFAVTPMVGGGMRRLVALLSFFEERQGATFLVSNIVYDRIGNQYKKNKLISIRQSRFKRLFFDGWYLKNFVKSEKTIDVYYSYGIPIYRRVGKLNWFHVSNTLMVSTKSIQISFKRKIEMLYLRKLFLSGLHNIDVVSGESQFTLDYLKKNVNQKKLKSINEYVVLENGYQEDEFLEKKNMPLKGLRYAIVVGSQPHRNIVEAYNVYKEVREKYKLLKFIIIGDSTFVIKQMSDYIDVIFWSNIKRKNLICLLENAVVYISASQIENSSNADIEGMILAKNAYVSDIGSRVEALKEVKDQQVSFPNIKKNYYCINKDNRKKILVTDWLENIIYFDRKAVECLDRKSKCDVFNK